MGLNSGFDALALNLSSKILSSVLTECSKPQRRSFQRKVFTRLLRKFMNDNLVVNGSPGIPHNFAPTERQFLRSIGSSELSSGLLTVAENQYGPYIANAVPSVSKRVAAIFHQPPSWHKLYCPSSEYLDKLGLILCLSTGQYSFFKSITSTPVELIRHGVALEYFKPPNNPSSRFEHSKSLLCVGHWLRDFSTLYKALQVIRIRHPSIILHCVIPSADRSDSSLLKLASCDNVYFHSGLSDHELMLLYQTSSALLLPLIDSAANNAIVEALSAGLPIVTTYNSGTRDYVSDACGTLCAPGDYDAHASAICDLLSDPQLALMKSQNCRKYAINNLSWDDISSHAAAHLVSHGLAAC